MLRHARMASIARAAAVLVAVSLSGAPRALAMSAPVAPHPCSCRTHAGGQHACACALCRKSAVPANRDPEPRPRCHRTAPHEAPSPAGTRGSRDVPCLEGTCGGGRLPVSISPGGEPFCLPSPRTVPVAQVPEPRWVTADPLHDRPLEPETPPPRAA